MINGIKLNTNNISMNQRRLRLKELALGTNSLTIKDKERLQPRHSKCITEVVSMVEIPKNRTQLVPKKPQSQPEDEIDLEEILKEMGYGESEDLEDDFESDVEEDETISNMSREELKTMIQNIVLDTMEEDDLNEIIENITKNY